MSSAIIEQFIGEIILMNAENDLLRRRVEELEAGSIHARGGERPNKRKLDREEVKLIREMARSGMPQSDIARSFDVNPSTICRILKGVYHR